MHSAQEPLSTPAKLGVSIAIGVVIAFTLLLAFLADFYIAGQFQFRAYESTLKSLVVACTFGVSVFVVCFFDLLAASRFVTGADRSRFVTLIS